MGGKALRSIAYVVPRSLDRRIAAPSRKSCAMKSGRRSYDFFAGVWTAIFFVCASGVFLIQSVSTP